MTWSVYILRFPNRKKYVGVTHHTAARRFKGHAQAALRGSRLTLHCAIRKYGAESVRVGCVAQCGTEAEAKRLEVEYINELNTLRPRGYNSTIGGEGVIDPSGMSEEIRIRAMRKTMSTSAYKERQRQIQRVVWNEGMRAERSMQIKRLWNNPKYRRHQKQVHLRPNAKCHRKVLLSVEERARRRRAIWSRPGYREMMSRVHKEAQGSAEYKARASAQMKQLMADPDYRRRHAERMRAVMRMPTVRMRCALSHRRAA